MKILAVDSSSMVATIAIAEDDNLIAEYTINHKKTHSQTLLPMIEEVFKMAEVDKTSIEAIAITGGPGSFTGLRIGSATVKGLGLAWNVPIINVPTMDAMAYVLYGVPGVICPMMDARREQVYTGLYSFEDGFEVIMEQQPMDVSELVEKINNLGIKVTFTGDGVLAYSKIIEEKINVPFKFAPLHLNRIRAGALATIAMDYAKDGRFETPDQHKPEYLRLSQAEREKQERENK